MTIKNKLDNRQSRQRAALDQISNDTDLRLDTILNLINDELTPPLRLTSDGVKTITVGASLTQTQWDEPNLQGTGTVSRGHKRKKSIPPISGTIPNFSGTSILIPNVSGGQIQCVAFEPYTTIFLDISVGNYKKMLISLTKNGYITLSFGEEGSSELLASTPPLSVDAFPIGYVVLYRNPTGNSIANISNEYIYQFSGSTAFNKNPNVIRMKQNNHSFSVGDVVCGSTGTAFAKAIASDSFYSNVVGMVSKIIDIHNFEVTTSGVVENITTQIFEYPMKYFLSWTQYGLLTKTPPDAGLSGFKKLEVGSALSSNSFLVSIKLPITVGSVPNGSLAVADLYNGSTTNIIDVSQYDAGEIPARVVITGTTTYAFFTRLEFCKKANNTYSLGPTSTLGDIPPLGYAANITSGGIVTITLPSIPGGTGGYVSYMLNPPAAGTSFPLKVSASNIRSNYKETALTSYSISVNDYFIVANGSSNTTFTLPIIAGSGASYIIRSDLPNGSVLTINPSSGSGTLIDSATNKKLSSGETIKITSSSTKWITESGISKLKSRVFATNGSWKCPDGVNKITVYGCGGGGGGGNANSTSGGGQGGGGSGLNTLIMSVTPGTTYSITIGAGGIAASSPGAPGNNGGDTIFNGITFFGGKGGGGANSRLYNGTMGGGCGGNGTGSFTASAGGNGFGATGGAAGSGGTYPGGGGGGGVSIQGVSSSGGAGAGLNSGAASGTGYGSGGGGGSFTGSFLRNGANGSSGFLMITWIGYDND